MKLTVLCALSLAASVLAHASMALPPPRAMHGKPIDCNGTSKNPPYAKQCNAGCTEQNCLWYQVGCMVGCDTCSLEGKEMWPEPSHVQCTRNGTLVPPGKTPYPVPRTVPSAARTWNIETKSVAGDFTKYMPWSSPGASPLVDPCGVASGFGKGAPPYVHAPTGYKIGDLGSKVLQPLASKTVVKAGGELEAGFGFQVNHGGGYQYRLCPATKPITEACFQLHPLDFATANHTIKWVDGSKADLMIPAMTIVQGTTPAGSQWRRIPFPACSTHARYEPPSSILAKRCARACVRVLLLCARMPRPHMMCTFGAGRRPVGRHCQLLRPRLFATRAWLADCDLGEGCYVASEGATVEAEFDQETHMEHLDFLEAMGATSGGPDGKCHPSANCATGGCKACKTPDACGECCPGCKPASEGKYTWCDCGKQPKKGGAQKAYEQQPNPPPRCPTGTQFPPPADDLYGYGDVPAVLVTDKLKMPTTLGD